MIRAMDIKQLEEMKRLSSNDMARILCDDCKGCSQCCRTVGDTILLDPYDIYNLCKCLSTDFAGLMNEGRIALGCSDGLVMPHLNIRPSDEGCTFLNREGRCTIHDYRPGLCRLYPLGRIYREDGGFDYYIQEGECPYPAKTKVRVSKWLGIEGIDRYEAYIRSFHEEIKNTHQRMKDNPDSEKNITVDFLTRYYVIPYSLEQDFYEQFTMRKSPDYLLNYK